MNKFFILFLCVMFVSCGKKGDTKITDESANPAENPTELGQQIFEGEGNCFACHKPDQKIIAPSIREIAKTYKTKNGNIVSFLKEQADPIVDPANFSTMKVNLTITKNMSDDQLKALEAYIYSTMQ